MRLAGIDTELAITSNIVTNGSQIIGHTKGIPRHFVVVRFELGENEARELHAMMAKGDDHAARGIVATWLETYDPRSSESST